MRTLILVIAILALATSAFAQTTQSWNFDDWSTQGWNLGGSGAVTQIWDDPENYTPQLYLPDGSYAWINVAETNSFVFTAKITWATNINRLQASGLGYHCAESGIPDSDVTAWFEGDNQHSNMKFKDTYAVDNHTMYMYDVLDTDPANTWNWRNAWMTIDYNCSQAGKVVLTIDAIDYVNANDPTDPKTFVYDRDLGVSSVTGDYYAIDAIRVGGAYSWSQTYVDDITFECCAVPEPGSMIALGTGLVGLVGFGIRRRK